MHLQMFITSMFILCVLMYLMIPVLIKKRGIIKTRRISEYAGIILTILTIIVVTTEIKSIPFEDSIVFRKPPYTWTIFFGISMFLLLFLAGFCRNKIFVYNIKNISENVFNTLKKMYPDAKIMVEENKIVFSASAETKIVITKLGNICMLAFKPGYINKIDYFVKLNKNN